MFKWIDSSNYTYRNWAVGKPSNDSNGLCIMMKSPVSFYDGINSVGNWQNVPCKKSNAVVCQKIQTWSLSTVQQVLLELRQKTEEKINALERELDNIKNQLSDTQNKVKASAPAGTIVSLLATLHRQVGLTRFPVPRMPIYSLPSVQPLEVEMMAKRSICPIYVVNLFVVVVGVGWTKDVLSARFSFVQTSRWLMLCETTFVLLWQLVITNDKGSRVLPSMMVLRTKFPLGKLAME